ncbi:MAG: hypothetical protein H6624_04410 [Bdellovibrionaceae bacterium]|nr:hypothetical protein [Bdellovibrionales bacterium]MCB9083559.1 hypothetical protein [Pseudobdellovibrionaceae bacterium]
MSKKLSKEEVRGPDAFVATSDKVGKWIEKNKVPVFSIIGALFVIGGIKVAWDQWAGYREKSAQEALYTVEAKIKKKQEEIAKELEAKKEKKEPAADRSLEADFGPLLSEYSSQINDLKGSKASLIASIHLAALYMDYKEFEKAKAFLAEQLPRVGKSGTFFGLLHMQMGTALAATGKNEEARSEFEMVVKDPGSAFLHAEAVLKLGLAEEILGNVDKARDHYNRASQEFSATDAGKTAKGYLRLMNLEKAAAGR